MDREEHRPQGRPRQPVRAVPAGQPRGRRPPPSRLALRVSGPLVLVLPLVAVLGFSLHGNGDVADAASVSAQAPQVRTTARPTAARTPGTRPAPRPSATAAARPAAATSPSPSPAAARTPVPAPSATPPDRRSTALPASSGTGRRVVVSKSRQRVWLVDADGAVRRTYLVSGMTSQPDPGNYRVFVRQAATSSAVDDSTMNWFVGFTVGKYQGATIGFHDIPRKADGRLEQTRAQLGTPLSAGCLRQWEDDAKALWAFAPIGTRVVVVA